MPTAPTAVTPPVACIHEMLASDAEVRLKGKGLSASACSRPMLYRSLLFRDLACSNGEIRLAGGTSVTNGRVEICRNQQWGTICGGTMTWEAADASVVCRQLGFSGIGE